VFVSFAEELTFLILLTLASVSFFVLLRMIDFIDHYSHIIYLMKPLKCKKCHVTFSIFRSCKHAKHSKLMPFIITLFFFSLIPGMIYVLVPYMDSLPVYVARLCDLGSDCHNKELADSKAYGEAWDYFFKLIGLREKTP
jgi:hypothetical protein